MQKLLIKVIKIQNSKLNYYLIIFNKIRILNLIYNQIFFFIIGVSESISIPTFSVFVLISSLIIFLLISIISSFS